MHGYAEIDIEEIKPEIRARRCPVAYFNTILRLPLILQMKTEDSKRQIEGNIFHHVDADSG